LGDQRVPYGAARKTSGVGPGGRAALVNDEVRKV
jgi:hypothetical protein